MEPFKELSKESSKEAAKDFCKEISSCFPMDVF